MSTTETQPPLAEAAEPHSAIQILRLALVRGLAGALLIGALLALLEVGRTGAGTQLGRSLWVGGPAGFLLFALPLGGEVLGRRRNAPLLGALTAAALGFVACGMTLAHARYVIEVTQTGDPLGSIATVVSQAGRLFDERSALGLILVWCPACALIAAHRLGKFRSLWFWIGALVVSLAVMIASLTLADVIRTEHLFGLVPLGAYAAAVTAGCTFVAVDWLVGLLWPPAEAGEFPPVRLRGWEWLALGGPDNLPAMVLWTVVALGCLETERWGWGCLAFLALIVHAALSHNLPWLLVRLGSGERAIAVVTRQLRHLTTLSKDRDRALRVFLISTLLSEGRTEEAASRVPGLLNAETADDDALLVSLGRELRDAGLPEEALAVTSALSRDRCADEEALPEPDEKQLNS